MRIGLGFLKRYHAMLDFPNRKLYLKRGLKSFKRDREDKSGIKLINDNGHLVIGLIDKRGPAADAGLATGDVISRVNSTAVSGSDLARARRVLNPDFPNGLQEVA
ncbi:PDZ domain-containing protein [bacterium]|nr:PDZ domain-containing protein [bacterium]